MTNKVFLMVGALLSLTSCNLYGGIDKPSGDNQILMAARACLDHGDYVCAQQNYQALSNNENDVKVSELALTALAQNGLFSMSDLLLALGSDRGSAKSLTAMSGLIAGRGKTDGTSRANIQSVFVSLTTIQDAKLKAFMQFLTATALVNQILAGAITSNNALAITDLVTGACAGICATDATCAKPAADLLLDTDVSGEPSSINVAANWNTAPSITKLELAIAAASTAAGNLGISGLSGISADISTINTQLAAYPGATAAANQCKRQTLVSTLF